MYKLNQVEGALGALLLRKAGQRNEMLDPAAFTTLRIQVKRLLEIDRARARNGEKQAFFEGSLPGKGTDATYDEFGACCLAVGVEMLRFGFKQKEVAAKIATVRPKLAAASRALKKRVIVEGSTTAVDNSDQKLPTKRTGRNLDKSVPDPHLFLVVDALEGSADSDVANAAGIAFCRGWEDMYRFMQTIVPRRQRGAFIIEVSELMLRMRHQLALEPVRRRGRS